MSGTNIKNEKYSTDPGENGSTPKSSTGTSGHKGSLRGNKIATRARSFKDDFLGKISQIRTQTNTITRSQSPNISRSRNSKTTPEDVIKPVQDLNYHVKQVKHALTHFKDVINKNKLEMLPGNGTIVLDMISNVHTSLQTYTLNENSSSLMSATAQVYLSLGKLIKFCDEILLVEDEENCATLNKDNVKEIVDLVENAVNNLVKIANEKISVRAAGEHSTPLKDGLKLPFSTLQRPMIDVAGQRTSLPDIPLTPREHELLEKSSVAVRSSFSTESILKDTSPPPKPPTLSSNWQSGKINNNPTIPPPLPPKRRSHINRQNSFVNSDTDYLLLDPISDHYSTSRRSRSPEDNSSLLSASAGSLDSALNNSRDEDELRAIQTDQSSVDDTQSVTSDLDKINSINMDGVGDSSGVVEWTNVENDKFEPTKFVGGVFTADGINHRHSYESGFVSMHSLRSSSQSVMTTKRISNQRATMSSVVHTATSLAGQKSESHFQTLSENTHQVTSQIQQQQLNAITTTSVFAGSHAFNFDELDKNFDNQLKLEKTINIGTSKTVSEIDIFDTASLVSDDVFESNSENEVPPALPVKTRKPNSRKERHVSTYDNVEEFDTVDQNDFDQQISLRFPSHPRNMHLNNHLGLPNKHQSLIEPRNFKNLSSLEPNCPPPLPIKKKHMFQSVAYSVMAYMEIFGNCSHTQNTSEFMRHSVHTYNISQSSENQQNCIMQSQSNRLTSSQSISLSSTSDLNQQLLNSPTLSEKPPALPPKRLRGSSRTITPPYIVTTPPPSPKILNNSTTSSTSISPKIFNITPEPTKKLNEINEKIKTPIITTTIISNKPPIQTTTTETTTTVTPTTTITTNPKKVLTNNTLTTTNNGTSNSSSTTTKCDLKSNIFDDDALTMNNFNNKFNNLENNNDKENYLHLCDTTTTTASTSTLIPNIKTSPQTININNDTDDDKLKIINSSKKNNLVDDNENEEDDNGDEVVLRKNQNNFAGMNKDNQPQNCDSNIKESKNLMEEICISNYLVMKKTGEDDGPDIRGGHQDALIIHATKRSNNEYGEAFITTFRTFIYPHDLIDKLINRYSYFILQTNDIKQRAAKETFSLLVRVVNDLTSPDLTSNLIESLMNFVYQLVCSGHLSMARLLRIKVLDKTVLFKLQKMSMANISLSSRAVIASPPNFLDLKAIDIAEQMTLLDAELFQKIEIPEVLIWAQEQCEERSPNLTRFTEHFNKMSYWARSQILKQEDAKDREKHVIKFIKIMKHLRKINNYNSYLALLSALDSAPIRRLDWHNQKQITESLKEYCALIDSSSSFRAYRQALADTNPPCIPYIGLVLQDLTFVHIGNQNYLSDNVINFSKRWQQYNIVVNMKRFKKCNYPFKKSEKIIGFFDNFENYLDEDAMWQISETIKPRGGRRQVVN